MKWPKTLVVDSDPKDAFQLHRAFKEAGVSADVYFVSDGTEAIEYLRAKEFSSISASATIPGLLLLKLDLSGTHGSEVLNWLRKHPHLRPVRVVVLSLSQLPEEVCRTLGADGCVALGDGWNEGGLSGRFLEELLGHSWPDCAVSLVGGTQAVATAVR